MSISKGRHVWFDLMTTDLEGAKAFYTETVGWNSQLWEQNQGPAPYTMWMVGERPIGGMLPMPEAMSGQGVPPHWFAHIASDDVDATAKKAETLGGRVIDIKDIPTVGRMAVIADPQGAVFSAFKPEGDMRLRDGEPEAGDIAWHELNTTDADAANRFYRELFGWKNTDAMDMGEGMGQYQMFQRADAEGSMGGMSSIAKQMKLPAHWLYYVHTKDFDACVARIQTKGGKLLHGPMEVPGGDRIAQFLDPQGASFAIHGK